MENRAFSKKLMLVTGILAAIVILFSQAFQKETFQIISKVKAGTENKAEKSRDAEKKVVIAAPAEAVTASTAVETEDTTPSLIREIILDEDDASKQSVITGTIVSDFFRTLFRVVISPQAP